MAESPAPAAPPPVRHRRRTRLIFGSIAGVLLLLLLLVLLVPAFLSSAAGTRMVLRRVNDGIAGSVRLQDMSLAWRTGQYLRGVEVLDPSGQVILTAERVDAADLSLLSLVRGNYNLGLVRVQNVSGRIEQDEQGNLNIARAFEPREPKPPRERDPRKPEDDSVLPPSLSAKLELTGSRISYLAPQMEPVELTDLRLDAMVPNPTLIDATLQTQVLQAGAAGAVNGHIRVARLFDERGRLTEAEAQIESDVQVAQFPVDVIDRLAQQDGRLVALIGPSMNAGAKTSGSMQQPSGTLSLKSEHLEVSAVLLARGATIVSEPGSSFAELTVQPEGWRTLSGSEAQTTAELEKPFKVRLDLAQARLALENGGVNLADSALEVTLTVSDIELRGAPPLGQAAVRNLRGSLRSDPLRKTARLELSASAEQAGQAGDVELTAVLNEPLALIGRGATPIPHGNITLQVRELPVAPIDEVLQADGLLVAALGRVLKADFSANLEAVPADAAAQDRGVRGELVLVATSDSLDARINGRITPERLELERDGRAQLTLTPTLTRQALRPKDGSAAPVELVEAAQLTLQIATLSVPITGAGFDWSAAAVELTLDSDALALQAPEPVGRVDVKGLHAQISSAALGTSTEASLRLGAQQDQHRGDVKLRAVLRNLLDREGNFDAAQVAGTITGALTNVPTALVDQLAQAQGRLLAAAGPTLDAELRADLAPGAAGTALDVAGAAGTFTFTAKAANLEARFAGRVAPEQVEFDAGSGATLTATQTLLASLLPEPADPAQQLKLAQPALLRLEIAKLRVPRREGKPALGELALEARLSSQALLLDAAEPVGRLALHDLVATVDSSRLFDGLRAKLNAAAEQAGKRGSVSVDVHLRQMVNAAGDISLDALAATLEAHARDLPVALVGKLAAQEGLATAALGETVTLGLDAAVTATAGVATLAGPFKLTAKSPRLDAQLNGRIAPEQLELADGSVVNLDVHPELIETLTRAAEGPPRPPAYTLAEPARLRVDIKQLSLPLDAEKRPHTRLELGAHLDRLAFAGDPALVGTALRDLRVVVPASKLGEQLVADLRGQFVRQEQTGTMQAQVKVFKPLEPQRTIEGSGTFRGVPMALIDALAQQEGLLVALLTDTLESVQFTAANDPRNPDTTPFTLKIDSTNLTTDLAGQYVTAPQGNRILLRPDATATLILTPDGAAALQKPKAEPGQPAPPPAAEPWLPEQPMRLVLAVPSAEIVLRSAPEPAGDTTDAPQPLPIDPATRLDLRLTSEEGATFRQRTPQGPSQAVPVRKVALAVNATNLREGALLTLQAEFPEEAAQGRPAPGSGGKINSRTQIANLVNARGEVSLGDASFQTETRGESLPVAMLDGLLQQEGKLLAALGQSTDLTLTGGYQPGQTNPLDLVLDSQNAKATVRAAIDPDKVMTLREDAVATMKLTRELSAVHMSKWNILLADAESGEQPVKMTIRKEDFAAPLSEFDMRKVRAQAEVELGTLTVRQNKAIAAALGLLSGVGVSLPRRDVYPAEFTTLQVTMADGVVASNDLWMTTPDMRIGARSRFAFGDDAKTGLFRDVLLGLSGEMFQKSRLARYIPADAVIELRQRGPSADPDFDVAQTVKSLLAAAAPGVVGEQFGGAIGQGLDLLGQRLRRDSPDANVASRAGWPNKPKPTTPAEAPASDPAPTPGADAPAGQQPSGVQPTAKPPAEPTHGEAVQGLIEGLLRRRDDDRRAAPQPDESTKRATTTDALAPPPPRRRR